MSRDGACADPVRLDARVGWALAGLLVFAAALRAVAASRTVVLFNDGPIFLALAEAIAAGRFDAVLAHPFHPLYPAAIAAVEAVSGAGFEMAARAVSIAGGTLAVAGAVFSARAFFGVTVGWLAGWTVALHPWAVDFSSDVQSDGLYGGFFALGFAGLAMALAADRPSRRALLVCGVFGGLAYGVRPEGAGLLLVGPVLLLVKALATGGDLRAARRAAAWVMLAGVVVMAPYWLALSVAEGELTLSRKKSVAALAQGSPGLRIAEAALANEARIPLPRSAERVQGGGIETPPRSIGGFASATGRAIRTSLAALRYEVAVFVVVGWVLSWRSGRRPMREATFLLPAGAYVGVLVLLVWGAGYVARRHALAPMLPLVAYAAVAWRALHASAVERWRDRFGLGSGGLERGALVALVLVLALAWGPRDLRERRGDRLALRQASTWLASHGGAGQVVAAQKLRLAYYAGGSFSPLPSGVSVPLRTALVDARVRYVVIDEARLDDHEGLRAGLGDWLEPVHVVEAAERRALVLALP